MRRLVLLFGLFSSGLAMAGPTFDLVVRGQRETERAPHGEGNVYAPEVHLEDGSYRLWYGGQGRDGHDRIHLAESSDGRRWTRRGVVLEDPSANHVNDPSIVKVDGSYHMFYTRAAHGIADEIALATSPDGVRWARRGVVLRPGRPEQWDGLLVGRPAVIHEDGTFRLWYDGRKDLPPGPLAGSAPTSRDSHRFVGLATSRDGLHWVKYPANPVFGRDAGGIDVKRLGGRYVMVYESREGTCAATSRDGISWVDHGLLMPRSGEALDRYGHVTPMLLQATGTTELFLGAARAASWDRNQIVRVRLGADGLERLTARHESR